MIEIAGGRRKRRHLVRRVVTGSAVATAIIAATAVPSFADVRNLGSRSCPSGRIVVTHSYAQQNVTHQVTRSGTLKSQSFTHTGWSYYDDYYYTGWQNVDSAVVSSNAAISAASADCVS